MKNTYLIYKMDYAEARTTTEKLKELYMPDSLEVNKNYAIQLI